MLLLRERDLRELLTMRALVPLMERALADLSSGDVDQPLRSTIEIPEYRGLLSVMPAYLRAAHALGLKAVTFYPANAEHGLATHLATILLIDVQTGQILAILDGRLITEMRTAAVSAAATKHLSSTRDPVVAILGAGVQARSHIAALREIRHPAQIRIWSRTHARAQRLAQGVVDRGGPAAVATSTAEEAVRGAHVICTVTGSTTPVLQGAWLSPGAHVNAVGAGRPQWRELDNAVLIRSQIFVDSRQAALVESGDLVQAIRDGVITERHIAAEIGHVFAGRHPGRTDPHSITLFKSVGLAVEDVATAALAYQLARAQQIGEEIALH